MEIDYSLMGLNKYEWKCYQALIKYGKSTAPKISGNSGVPFGRVYDILKSLELKGLVLVVPGDKKEYFAEGPNKLLELLGKKEKDFKDVSGEIKKLEQVYQTDGECVEVVKGENNFWRSGKRMPKPTKSTYVIRYLTAFKPEWAKKHKERLKKGIDVKNIVDKNRAIPENLRDLKKSVKEIKHLKNEGVTIWIVDEKAIMFGLVKKDTTVIIRDKALAKMMNRMYLDTYKAAEKI